MAEPEGTRDSQTSGGPVPLLGHVLTPSEVVACTKHGIGAVDRFTFLFVSFCWDPQARCHLSPGRMLSSVSFHDLSLLKTCDCAGLGT